MSTVTPGCHSGCECLGFVRTNTRRAPGGTQDSLPLQSLPGPHCHRRIRGCQNFFFREFFRQGDRSSSGEVEPWQEPATIVVEQARFAGLKFYFPVTKCGFQASDYIREGEGAAFSGCMPSRVWGIVLGRIWYRCLSARFALATGGQGQGEPPSCGGKGQRLDLSV